jgi:predicted RNase H-like nuclease (RuvC/YqgF family)
VDFAIEQEKETCNNLIKILGMRIRKLREQLESEADPEKRARIQEDLNQTLEKQRENSEKLSELLKKTVNNEDAVVEISGEVVPGTIIEICHIGFPVTEPLHRVRIKLEQGMIITGPLC